MRLTISRPSRLPAGDLDGDGTPEVFVQKFDQQPGALKIKHAATLPLQVLSGRTGRPTLVGRTVAAGV